MKEVGAAKEKQMKGYRRKVPSGKQIRGERQEGKKVGKKEGRKQVR